MLKYLCCLDISRVAQMVKIVDIRTMQPLPPLSFPAGAYKLKVFIYSTSDTSIDFKCSKTAAIIFLFICAFNFESMFSSCPSSPRSWRCALCRA